MDDVIQLTGHRFGANECFKLFALSLAAIPTSFIIFMELVTDEQPEVCVWDITRTQCDLYDGNPADVCMLANQNMWEYDYPLRTVIGTYDLLCKDRWERCLPQLLFYLGMLPSCILAGYLSDKFGRKTMLLIFFFLESAFLIGLILARTFAGFIVLRFFTGLCVGYFVNVQTLIIEGLKVEHRNTFLASIWCFFSVGTMILGLLSTICERYIDMVACVVTFNLVLLVLYLLGMIDESLRWLLMKGKKDRAQYMLNKLAYQNNVKMPKYEDIPKPADEQYSIKDFFVHPKSRMMTFILLQLSVLSFYLWVDFTKYTINSAMSEENCERYGFKGSEQARAVNFVLSGCVNMVGVVLTSVLCRVVGRRPTLILEMLACLVVLILWIAMPDQRVVIEICSYIVRLVAPGMVYLSSLYAVEVHITPLRARAVGLCTAGLAFGGILCSINPFFWEQDNTNIILVGIETALVLYVLILSLKLPETKGRALPDTVDGMPGTVSVSECCQCKKQEETVPLLEDHGHSSKHEAEE